MDKTAFAIQVFNFQRKGYTHREIANVLRVPVSTISKYFSSHPPKYLSTILHVKKPHSVLSTETRDVKVTMPVIGEVLVSFRPRFEQDEDDPSQYHTRVDVLSVTSTQSDKEYSFVFMGALSQERIVKACLESMPQI